MKHNAKDGNYFGALLITDSLILTSESTQSEWIFRINCPLSFVFVPWPTFLALLLSPVSCGSLPSSPCAGHVLNSPVSEDVATSSLRLRLLGGGRVVSSSLLLFSLHFSLLLPSFSLLFSSTFVFSTFPPSLCSFSFSCLVFWCLRQTFKRRFKLGTNISLMSAFCGADAVKRSDKTRRS